MKKQTFLQKTAAEKRYERLYKLIKACTEQFSEEEMVEVFNQIAGTDYVEEKDHDGMVSELVMAGYCIFKPESSAKSDMLKEYAETVVFPYYNEQGVSILF